MSTQGGIFWSLLSDFWFDGYSYDAAEDNELSFREGDRISEIEAASDDWWSGRDEHGNVGLLLAAYVEVEQ